METQAGVCGSAAVQRTRPSVVQGHAAREKGNKHGELDRVSPYCGWGLEGGGGVRIGVNFFFIYFWLYFLFFLYFFLIIFRKGRIEGFLCLFLLWLGLGVLG